MGTLVLTEALRRQLKEPLGELITGSPAECSRKLKEVVEREKPSYLILVGDRVSRSAFQIGIKPNVTVIDNMEKRQKAPEFGYQAENVFRAENVAGTIGSQAWEVVKQAVKRGDSLVTIDGEEDLLTLVAVLSAPDNSIVAYGQPDEGIVLVRVTPDKKREINEIVEQMSKMT